MALTKVDKSVSSTPGIVDNSDATAITIDSSENVGINTTSPTQKLDVNGYIKATRIGAGISPIVPCEVLSTGATSTALRVLKSGSDDSTQNNLFSVTEISGHGRLSIHDTSQNEDIRLDSNGDSYFNGGNVGIGTASPSYKLEVSAEAAVEGDVRIIAGNRDKFIGGALNDLELGTYSSNNTSRDVHLSMDSAGGVQIGASSIANLKFSRSGDVISVTAKKDGTDDIDLTFHTQASGGVTGERMRITSGGEVILGSTAIGSVGGVSSSHWSQALSGTKWCHTFKSSNSSPYGIAIKYSAIPNNTTSAFIYCEDGTPAPRFSVRSNGGVQNYSGNNVNLSDKREKKNIVAADNQLENIKNLVIKSFHYNEDDDSADKRLGVIAQEVETNLPHLVDEYSNIEGEERKGVKEQQFMWMAIKAIQEQQTQIEALQSEINTLKGGD